MSRHDWRRAARLAFRGQGRDRRRGRGGRHVGRGRIRTRGSRRHRRGRNRRQGWGHRVAPVVQPSRTVRPAEAAANAPAVTAWMVCVATPRRRIARVRAPPAISRRRPVFAPTCRPAPIHTTFAPPMRTTAPRADARRAPAHPAPSPWSALQLAAPRISSRQSCATASPSAAPTQATTASCPSNLVCANATACNTGCTSDAACVSTHYCSGAAAACPSWATASPAPPPTSAPPARAAASTATPTADSYGVAATTTFCGTAAPPGYVADASDCCDADMNVRPGQTNWFTSGSAACGGTFDYNCANGPELQYGSGIGRLHHHGRVHRSSDPTFCAHHAGLVGQRGRLRRRGDVPHRPATSREANARPTAPIPARAAGRCADRHHRAPDAGLPLIPGLASVDPKSAARRPRLEPRELVWRSSDARIRVRVLALPGAEIGQVARRAGGLGRRGLRRGRRYPPSTPCPEVLFDGEIPVGATNTMINLDTKFSASGSDPSSSVRVDFQDNKGTVEFAGSGPVPAFIYKRIPWLDVGFTLYAGLGVTDGAWLLFWIYCAPDGTLGRFYGERTDATGTLNRVITGTCSESATTWSMPVEAPAHTLRNIPMTCGFSVATADRSIQSGQARGQAWRAFRRYPRRRWCSRRLIVEPIAAAAPGSSCIRFCGNRPGKTSHLPSGTWPERDRAQACRRRTAF